MELILLILELVALWAVSGSLTQAIYNLTILVFRARSVGVTVVAILTFPGTVVHELSHLFTAEILGVHTGKLTLVPENIQETEVKAGSVMIGHSDPFRRYLIGLAPMIAGLVSLAALAYFLDWTNWATLLNLILVYLLFAVSSSMFSSNEDLKGFIPFAITLGAMIAAAYIAGLRVGLTGTLLTIAVTILTSLVKSLGIVLGINIAGLILTKAITALVLSLTHRKLIRS